jgi:hypothetical protein
VSRRPLILLSTVLLALATLAVVAAPRSEARKHGRAPIVIGVAEQKTALFTDARFRALRITHVRRDVAWDALKTRWERAELDHWMALAKAAGVQPLVTFDHSRKHGRTRVLPSVGQLVAQFRAVRRRYPWVHEFSTWNEANFNGEATFRHPELVARYYRALKRACRSCTVLGADLLDVSGMTRWVKRFVRVAGQPRYWGLHNYVTANRFQTKGTRALLRITRGQIWLTETGGLVARRNHSRIRLPQGKAHQAQVTRFVLGRLAALSPRVSRAYLYQWNAATRHDSWDSALVGPDGRARPALSVLRKALLARR